MSVWFTGCLNEICQGLGPNSPPELLHMGLGAALWGWELLGTPTCDKSLQIRDTFNK